MAITASAKPLVLCSWCADPKDPRHAEASHTICASCVVKFESGARA